LVAFLRSSHGSLSLQRIVRGTIQRNLNIGDLLEHPILLPDAFSQRYIGDKLRQAERLRERARKLADPVRQHHGKLIPAFRPSKAKWNTFRVGPRAIEDVIVPHFYPPAVTEYLAAIPNESLSHLCVSIYSGETYEPDDEGVDQATSRSCTGRFLRRPCNLVRPPSRADLDLQVHDLLLTNAAHDKAYIGTDVTYYHGGPRNVPSAKVMVLRPDRSIVPASYLFAYLKTPVGYLQVQSAIRGISAGIRAQDIGTIRIPLPALRGHELAAWLSMDSLMVAAGASEEMAGILCAAATQLVERLIEGRITEADLVAAHKALEGGDRVVDKTILQSLRQSDGPAGSSLLPEVDGLYALLDAPEETDP
jgi:type I restriction enzyme S subunit